MSCGICRQEDSFKNYTCRHENTMPLKDDLSPKPHQKNCLTCLLQTAEKQHFSAHSVSAHFAAYCCCCCFCCYCYCCMVENLGKAQLPTGRQLQKKHLPAGIHHAPERRAKSKTAPKNCLTCLLKPRKNNIFRHILLPTAVAAASAAAATATAAWWKT